MTMSHKEALSAAMERAGVTVFDEDYDTLIRAYLDARGLVMVPKEPTEYMLDFGACYEDQDHDIVDEGEISRDVYKAMLAAAPDPFGGE